ncbi:phosphoenolpyruvate--protein phosphotransferase [Balneola vulgaris]|uniref:phosphoenolpyruvate--protein phosphotransferase n=1 Tax=Balneola vulgaris TaxID=287535 RepID=UPI00037E55FB|nr:phosphoenolpyruvate--protein phosphotransferase [Balneola vulgaris]
MSNMDVEALQTIDGISASPGIAIGELVPLDNTRRKVLPKEITSADCELHKQAFVKARTTLVSELDEMLGYLDSTSRSIIETQKQIALDLEIERKVVDVIENKLMSGDYAVYHTFCEFIERLKESGSELFQQRIVDLENLRDRFIDHMCKEDNEIKLKKGDILVAKDLSPTELVSYHESGLSGIVMERGGVTSHAALIAQSLQIPCVVNAPNALRKSKKGTAILDGREGKLILNPDDEALDYYKKKLKKLKRSQKRLLKNLSEPNKTKSNTSFNLAANIEFESELGNLKKYNAEQIGLLRTEGLLFQNKISNEEQTSFYESVLKSVKGEVTVRLFDVGGDKIDSRIAEEANPFLGWRGIRMLLDEKTLLRNQLKALLTCSGFHKGRLKILVPMISMLEEVIQFKTLLEQVRSELEDEGIETDADLKIGVMIEVPSAALMAEEIAKEVDFMSIGTNDLTQYTLAVDRGNEKICGLYQQQHPALWKLIKVVVDAGESTNTEVTVCGELAGDVLGACGLYGLGVRNLSMITASIPKVKEELISHIDKDFGELAQYFLNANTTEEIKAKFEEWRLH